MKTFQSDSKSYLVRFFKELATPFVWSSPLCSFPGLMLITMNSAAALPLWGAIGCTALGAAFGGLIMLMVFGLKTYFSKVRIRANMFAIT